MPDPEEMTTWETAWAACGEPVGEHESPNGPQATVLQMALVGTAIANEGAIMQPYLVDGIYNANGERSFSPIPVKLKQAMDADTAAAELDVLWASSPKAPAARRPWTMWPWPARPAPTSAVTAAMTAGSWEWPPPPTPKSWWPSSSRRANRGLAPAPPTTFWKRLSEVQERFCGRQGRRNWHTLNPNAAQTSR